MKSTLSNFQTLPLKDAARQLLAKLGYTSDKSIAGAGSSPQSFLDLFGSGHTFDQAKALFTEWKTADLLFQLTDEELSRQSSLFTDNSVHAGLLKSYVFIAIELKGGDYARGKFSAIARQINRLFPMPVMVFFRHQNRLTIAVINRRRNKLDESKDVLGKVTLISAIDFARPHRGHLDILDSLALSNLVHPQKRPINNFDTLHEAWEQIFNVELLNERFYRELANWYFWALPQIEFPADLEPDKEKRNATGLIRLLTRIIFCWFLKEKNLIPEKLFHPTDLATILKGFDPESEASSTYYQAILQNLFFATLNQRMGKDAKGQPYRTFAKDEGFLKNKVTYDVNNLYRYESFFRESPEDALSHFADIPFLNGGLFECLDRTEDGTDKKRYLDGFSRTAKKRPSIPDRLFFDSGETADLSDAYGDKKRKAEKVTGLIPILNRYKFTIVENTPIDQEIALDPELLGKVFENLLAAYNEETKTTARKQTGSFYTPRPIVDYMVDETLKVHFTRILVEKAHMTEPSARAGLDVLFTYTEQEHPFDRTEVATLIAAIDDVKILDPACGSGAFPMGALHKLVYILGKLDPDNDRWKQTQLDKLDSAPMREALEAAFADNNDDYGRKLYLIENCLYGADIQPIAIQITKLRFFISLICDQKTNRNKRENLGIRPLPNLETKFVAANSLIGLPELGQMVLAPQRVYIIEKEIEVLYHNHFSEQRRDRKLANQRKIKSLRLELAKVLSESLMAPKKAQHIADWDPFDPQSSADFFDPHWMFGRSLANGFDIVIGNPPYVDSETMTRNQPQMRQLYASVFLAAKGNWDLFILFIEKGYGLLAPRGLVSFIVPNKVFGAPYSAAIRNHMADNCIHEMRDYSRVRVFKDADVYPIVFVAEKSKSHKGVRMTVMSDIETIEATSLISQKTFYKDISWDRYFTGDTAVEIDAKCLTFPPLEKYFSHISGAATVSEAYQFREVVREQDTRFTKPFKRLINTGTIDRYCSLWGIRPTRYLKGSYTRPIVSEDEIRKVNSSRLNQARTAKIIIGGMTRELECFYDEGEYLAGKSTVIILEGNKLHLKCALAFLNSKLVSYWYQNHFKSMTLAGGYLRIGQNEIRSIPIPEVDQIQATKIISLVDRILSAKKENGNNADTIALEREIDQMVYALYCLTPLEIAFVEGTVK
jgi:type I restriction-modification system DNA methylase subunit